MLQDFAQWLQDELHAFALWLLDLVLSAAAALLSAIPVPDWATSLPSLTAALSPGVLWFANLAALPFGASVVGSAYALRWFIRRLPFVG